MRGFLVTGTDTGVGKTAVACGILATLRAEGMKVAGFKPAESGHDPHAWPPDARALAEASGGTLRQDEVVPYVFAEALAPAVAARRAGIRIDLHMVRQRYVALARRHDLTLVEGAGGLLVPLADGTDFADVADAWQLPILIVARAGLGTLNHTALSVQCAQARGLEVLGVIINNMPDRPDVASKTNPEELARLIDVPILGVIPHQDGVNTDTGAWQPMAKAVAEHVDLASIRILAR